MNLGEAPDGFARVIDARGTVMEGSFTKDGLRNGWSICYNGQTKVISYGWYENELRTGNYMEYNPRDMNQRHQKCGWYVKDRRKKNIQADDPKYKVAYPKDIFLSAEAWAEAKEAAGDANAEPEKEEAKEEKSEPKAEKSQPQEEQK